MRKMLSGAILVMGLLSMAQAAGYQTRGGGADTNVPTANRGGAIFETITDIEAGPWTTPSTKHLSIAESSTGADDFTVDGNGWHITEVEVRGAYDNDEGALSAVAGPAASVDIYILAGGAALPASTDLAGTAVYAATGLTYADAGEGDFIVTLPGGLDLPPGDYWLVVRANMSWFDVGFWGWTESANVADSGNVHGEESAWFQTGNFFLNNDDAIACEDAWGARTTTCNNGRPADALVGTNSERDLAFSIHGNVLTPSIVVNGGTDAINIGTTEDGATADFDVALGAIPTGGADVVVSFTGLDASEGTVSPTTLTFNAGNWDVPQDVTVTGIQDAPEAVDGDVAYTLVPTANTAGGFDGETGPDVNVTNVDANGPASIATTVTSDTLAEDTGDGVTANTTTVTVTITADPDDAGETVTIPLSVSDAEAGSVDASVVIVIAANSPQGDYAGTATFTTNPDVVDEDDLDFSIVVGDPSSTLGASIIDNLSDTSTLDVPMTITDNDTAGVDVTAGSIDIVESGVVRGGPVTFSVALDTEPTADVVVAAQSSDSTEAVVSPATLTFTSANWDTTQDFTITPQPDDFDDDSVDYSVIFDVSSDDTKYDGLSVASLTGTSTDDGDTAGISISSPTATTDEGGSTTTITVTLDAQPITSASVEIDLVVGDDTEGEISADGVNFGSTATLVIGSADWDTGAVLSIRGLDDNIRADGNISYSITATDITSGDTAFAALDAGTDWPSLTVTNNDDANDNPGFTLNPTDLGGFDEGTTTSFTVVLDSEPTADVVFSVESGDTTEATVDAASLTFTSANWNTPQTVTVTGVEDFLVDDDESDLITVGVSSSADGNFSVLADQTVAFTVNNIDTCSVDTILVCTVGQTITVANGTPTCHVDLYISDGSNDINNWSLVASDIEVDGSGNASLGVTCDPDTLYVLTAAGGSAPLGAGGTVMSVPTLGEWALMIFIGLIAVAGVVAMRRTRVA